MTRLWLMGATPWCQQVADDLWVRPRVKATLLGPADGAPAPGEPLLLVFPSEKELAQAAAHNGPTLVYPEPAVGLGWPLQAVSPWGHHEVVQKARAVVAENFLGRVNQWHARLAWLAPQPPPADIALEVLKVVSAVLKVDYTFGAFFGQPELAQVALVKGAANAPVGSVEVVNQPGYGAPHDPFPFTLQLDFSAALGLMHLRGLGAMREQEPGLSLYRRKHEHTYMTLEHRFVVALVKAALAKLGT